MIPCRQISRDNMKYFLLTILVFCLALEACNTRAEYSDITTVDLTGRHNSMQFNLNEHASDLKIIRLESNDSALIRYFWGHVGEKYIISVERDKVLLFTSRGEFIRTISSRGKGPGEFTQIDSWIVDENENFLLYHDYQKNYICNYNLNSQQWDENIPFEDHGYLGGMVLVNDTILSILPSLFSEYGYLYFNQTFTGQITGGVTRENIPHPGSWSGKSPVFKKNPDNSIIFQASESDTVFRIDGSRMVPIYSFLVEKPQKNGDITTGSFVSYLHSDKNQLLVSRVRYESVTTATSSSLRATESEYLSYDLKTMKTNKIDPLSFEVMDMELEASNVFFPDRDQILITYQAVDFKKMIGEAIKKDDITASRKERLMQLDSEISENDNPIIITGKWN